MTEGRVVTINGRWDLWLPEHRANRAEWVTGWEAARLDSMAANIHPGDVVFDVGTEEGDLSALYAQWVQNSASWDESVVTEDGVTTVEVSPQVGGVVLIEPNPRVWSNIRAIFDGNDLPDPLACVVGFAGEKTGTNPSWDGEHVTRTDPADVWPSCAFGPLIGDHGFLNLSERPDVPVITIDTLATDYGCDAITVDVEGAELFVMRGAELTLRRDRPLVWISVHPEFANAMYGVHEQDLHSFMHSCGYVKRWLARDHEHHWLYAPEERADAVVLQERADWT